MSCPAWIFPVPNLPFCSCFPYAFTNLKAYGKQEQKGRFGTGKIHAGHDIGSPEKEKGRRNQIWSRPQPRYRLNNWRTSNCETSLATTIERWWRDVARGFHHVWLPSPTRHTLFCGCS